MRVECQDQTQPAESTYVCQSARGFAPIQPSPPVGAATAHWHDAHTYIQVHKRKHFISVFIKIRRKRTPVGVDLVDTVCIRRREPERARYIITVKLRPGRIRRPPDFAEHQLWGRWLSINDRLFILHTLTPIFLGEK